MGLVLGVSAFFHDSAAALVEDGRILAAAEEERFSRKKHDSAFPAKAIEYCLSQLPPGRQIDSAVYYEDPVGVLDRILRTTVTAAPDGDAVWQDVVRTFLPTKLRPFARLRATLGEGPKLLRVEHHLAHAAAAFYPSGLEDAAIVVVDGVGEWATTSIAAGSDSRITVLREMRFPHSLGLLYAAFTHYCGFKVNSGEYKLMGLAPFGQPRYADVIRRHLIDVRDDGSFRLDMDYFGFLDSKCVINTRFEVLFGGPARRPESAITAREADLAASVQAVTEEVLLKLAATARQLTGSRNLCLAGGVALNCVANGKIAATGMFDRIWVQPAAGDAGGALGAALLASHQHHQAPRHYPAAGRDLQSNSLLGPRFAGDAVDAAIRAIGCTAEVVPDRAERHRVLAQALADGLVVGYFSGRMEFGPRALGARSILADPRRRDAQSVVNQKIKFRESWRPFAPAVLAEDASDYFDLRGASPYMLMTAPVARAHRVAAAAAVADAGAENGDRALDLLAILGRPRSDIPAVTHVDFSARVQTVDRDDHPDFHALILAFKALTGCSVLLNTSFNVRGEPIVCTPLDALLCFLGTGMDVLALEDRILFRDRQDPAVLNQARMPRYELD